MPRQFNARIVVISVVLVAMTLSPLVLVSGQITHTSTSTETASMYVTSTLSTVTTSLTVSYVTTTEIMSSTILGTQTRMLPALTTATSTLTYTVGGTVVLPTSITVTSVSTQTTQIVGNIWGEMLASLLVAAAAVSLIAPRTRPKPPKGMICGKCGNLNPPFVTGFCVKCGGSLKDTA